MPQRLMPNRSSNPLWLGHCEEQVGFTSKPGISGELRIGAHSLHSLRAAARREAIDAGHRVHGQLPKALVRPSPLRGARCRYTLDCGWPSTRAVSSRCVVQNFLLSQASQQTTCVALNLVIDNDLCRSPAIRVPVIDKSSDAAFSANRKRGV